VHSEQLLQYIRSHIVRSAPVRPRVLQSSRNKTDVSQLGQFLQLDAHYIRLLALNSLRSVAHFFPIFMTTVLEITSSNLPQRIIFFGAEELIFAKVYCYYKPASDTVSSFSLSIPRQISCYFIFSQTCSQNSFVGKQIPISPFRFISFGIDILFVLLPP